MKNLKAVVRGMVMAILLGAPPTALATAEPFIGEIMMFGGNFCPRGWMNADGQLLRIKQNDALFPYWAPCMVEMDEPHLVCRIYAEECLSMLGRGQA